jgi:urease accessory protein
MRFPKVHARASPLAHQAGGPPCEGTLINTGGGMAGGDRLAIEIEAGPRAHVLLSTPSAERVYGSTGLDTEISVGLALGDGARLAWLPRETILFDGARLTRRLDAEMKASATLILAEMTIFGRLAMGEELRSGLFAERWNIRRDGRLLHAERTRIAGEIGELLDRAAIGGGARAAATAIIVSPQAEDRLDAVRARLNPASCEWGASAWNGMLVGRFLGADATALRADLVRFLLGADEAHLPHAFAGDRDAGRGLEDSAIERSAFSMPDSAARTLMESEVESDPA